jgi:GntR family transcriptional repressor for pyruvate dehydrogenase complex
MSSPQDPPTDGVTEDAEALRAFRAEPIVRPRQQVENQIKAAILSGVFGQGEKLPSETRLATEFSVSRATVREALRSLAAKGLIRKMPGSTGGSFVEYIDHHVLATVLHEHLSSTLELGSITYEEVAQFRNVLEIPSARLAAGNRTEEQLELLHDIVAREKEIAVTDPEVQELNVRFHCSLGEASGNRVLAASVAALHRVARPLTFIDQSAAVGRDAVRHHIAIVAAVERRNEEEAAGAMGQHLEYLRSHAA